MRDLYCDGMEFFNIWRTRSDFDPHENVIICVYVNYYIQDRASNTVGKRKRNESKKKGFGKTWVKCGTVFYAMMGTK